MFLHRKELIQPVNVGTPDARFGTYLLEQFGGATGELTAALQYWVQSFHVENAGIRDMLQDIAIEEFSHLEMVGKLIAQHTSKIDQTAAYDPPIFKLKGGGPHFLDSQGSCWTAAYIQEGGNVVRDRRAPACSHSICAASNSIGQDRLFRLRQPAGPSASSRTPDRYAHRFRVGDRCVR